MIKRYSLSTKSFIWGHIHENPQGDWVPYKDYEKLWKFLIAVGHDANYSEEETTAAFKEYLEENKLN